MRLVEWDKAAYVGVGFGWASALEHRPVWLALVGGFLLGFLLWGLVSALYELLAAIWRSIRG